ncbi:hypothetical protein [Burkholderia vietnamiensis]|jgi:hypothetical protein|uniref:hypothetical protein n=1 Tax=Burkholderia vietnamiensis TaxID=60552 RepID=UPI0012D92590|nr:hypothetical protein [Burkholderia vietnamiensis]MBR8357213.1 hypothetical protein [Burkholderia vietnamiensis]
MNRRFSASPANTAIRPVSKKGHASQESWTFYLDIIGNSDEEANILGRPYCIGVLLHRDRAVRAGMRASIFR